MTEPQPRCKVLVLDSGPLLSLSPLRGLAQTYLTVPQVLDELKDKRAREHFERLGLSAGVHVEIRNPDAPSLARGMSPPVSTNHECIVLPVCQSYNSQRKRATIPFCHMLICAFWR